MIRLSVDSVTGFSIAPLRAATWLGLCGGFAALALLVYALAARGLGHTLPGWTSTVVAVAAMGAVQLLCLGVLGEYVGRMYAQLQGRPTYFIAYDSYADGSAAERSDAGVSATDTSGAENPRADAQQAVTEPGASPYDRAARGGLATPGHGAA